MTPEDTMKAEEIESSITWIKLLAPHSAKEQKSLLLELHAFGEISDDKLSSLISLLRLRKF